MNWRGGCPSAKGLERAYWSGDVAVAEHARACESCGRAWREIERLAAATRELGPAPAERGRREEIRASLLAGATGASPPARRGRVAWGAGLVAAAAAIAATWWLRPSSGDPAAGAARVLDHGGAHYLVATRGADQVVRLVNGAITVDASERGAGGRVRVVTGDGEVEAMEAAFDVTARADRLSAVRALSGEVIIRASGEAVRAVRAGQTWTAAASRAAAPAAARGDEVVAASPRLAPSSPPLGPPARGEVDRGVPAKDRASPAADRVSSAAGVPRQARSDRRKATDPPPFEPASPRPPPEEPPGAPEDTPEGAPARSAAAQAFDDGWAAIRAGSFDEAAAAFDRSASLGGDPERTADALFWSAVSLARAGRADAAARGFEGFLAAYPGSIRAGEANAMLGWLLLERGDLGSAETRFRAAAADRSERVRASGAAGLEAVRGSR